MSSLFGRGCQESYCRSRWHDVAGALAEQAAYGDGVVSMLGGPQQNGFDMLNLDMNENEREVVVLADLLGVNKSDIEVFVDDGVLTIRAEGSILKRETASFNLADRRFRLFGFMRLPCSVDVDRIQTNFDDGVLIVTLPKRNI